MGLQEQQLGLQQQQMQQQLQNFLLQKKMTIGGMAVSFFEKMATAKPEQRQVMMELGGAFLGPLLKEIGFDLPPTLLRTLATAPGAATRFGALIGDMFGDEASVKAVTAEIANLDEKDIPAYIEKRFKMAQDAALPRVQQTITQYAQLIRRDPGLQSRLGLLDDKGKSMPIPGNLIMGQIDQVFKSNAEKAAAMRVLGTPEFAPFLANIGILPGTIAESQMKILAESATKLTTPQGAADLRAAQAKATTAEAEAGVAPAKAKASLEQTQAATAKTRAEIAAAERETTAGKATEIGALRQQFNQQAKDFITVKDAYSKIEAATREPSAAGDLSLIFAYMRLLDPGSTVREGEFATAQNTAGVPDRVRSIYNRVVSGERLAETQRADFLTQAKNLFGEQLASHEELEGQYKGIAQKRGWDPDEAVPDYAGRFRALRKGGAKKEGAPGGGEPKILGIRKKP